ncbi:MAG TPA: ornithine aminomutase subunit alpha [Bacilli bacterium]|nr:MAG: D-ornithine 4,5-aminomutase subunit alpha [Tenericutes bacterium ADurb.BinA124]HNZ50787.1 ornithine aminomutase subunit alpha [Bacilli bacterium]HPN61330.1 ornithine aminomutase subunit alpha [Bacilli bacterium]HPX84150.1 ornithine aminomutase subunit alpha [Bacilli bacterium]HQC75070.1 ornithine aminomutase subunit alpha [Bacilli bacterium]
MDKPQIRPDDFEQRRAHLRTLSDEQLYELFWKYAEKTTQPLIQLAYNHTSPAIERSVLLRMGFSSLEAKVLVEKTIDHQLMGKGAGHVVFRYAKITGQSLREAGLCLMKDQGWAEVLASFGGKPC